MPREFLKCHDCKELFRRDELISYATLRSATSYNYCKKCYDQKRERENFSEKVCAIFGLKSPGPRIWAERKKIQDTFGYTDATIIDCLDYIYKVKNFKKLSESLCLVKPSMVDEMMRYKRREEKRKETLVNAFAAAQPVEKVVVSIKENDGRANSRKFDADEWLDED